MPLDISTILQRKARLPLKRSRVKASKLTPNKIAKQRIHARRQFPAIENIGTAEEVRDLITFFHMKDHSREGLDRALSSVYMTTCKNSLQRILNDTEINPNSISFDFKKFPEDTEVDFDLSKQVLITVIEKLNGKNQAQQKSAIETLQSLQKVFIPGLNDDLTKEGLTLDAQIELGKEYANNLKNIFDYTDIAIEDETASLDDNSELLESWDSDLEDITEATSEQRKKISRTKRGKILKMLVFPSVYQVQDHGLVIDNESLIETEMLEAAISIMQDLPNKVINLLRRTDFKFYLGRKINDIDPLANSEEHQRLMPAKFRRFFTKTIPGFFIETRLHPNDMPAFHRNGDIWISEKLWSRKPLHERVRELREVILEEVSHAICFYKDTIPGLQEMGGNRIARIPEFQAAYDLDFEKLTKDQKIRHRYLIQLDFQTRKPGDHGYREVVADLISIELSKGRYEGYKHLFPNAHKWVKENVMPHVT